MPGPINRFSYGNAQAQAILRLPDNSSGPISSRGVTLRPWHRALARIMHEDEIFVAAVAQSERFT
jgi:hypothetical protein